MYQAFIDDSHDKASSEPSLSCGSNAGMLQRNHPRLHWMHTQHAMHPCIQTYPSCCRCSSLYPSPLPRQSVPFHSQTAKDILSIVNDRLAADIIGANPRTWANDASRTCRSRWQVRLDHTSLISCAKFVLFLSCCICLCIEVFACCERNVRSFRGLRPQTPTPDPAGDLRHPDPLSASPFWNSWIRHCLQSRSAGFAQARCVKTLKLLSFDASHFVSI